MTPTKMAESPSQGSSPQLPILLDEAYRSVERLIWQIVHRYHERFGGDKEELMSIGREYFMEAAHSWDPNRGAFTTHVYWRVFYGLRTEATRSFKNNGFLTRDPDVVPEQLVDRPHFLESFLADLSDKASKVVHAAIDLNGMASADSLTDLLIEAGWSSGDILQTFEEIRNALDD